MAVEPPPHSHYGVWLHYGHTVEEIYAVNPEWYMAASAANMAMEMLSSAKGVAALTRLATRCATMSKTSSSQATEMVHQFLKTVWKRFPNMIIDSSFPGV